jgi:hypothetical protein
VSTSGQSYPINPDAFFGLRFPKLPEGRNRAFFLLEADRSTMTTERFMAKLRAYAAWRAAGGHTRLLGTIGFRVVTVTISEDRLRTLLSAAVRAEGLGDLASFWFASETRFRSGPGSPILDLVWETPDQPGARKTILPWSIGS